LNLLANVSNELNATADANALAEIELRLGVFAKSFQRLYGLHNGMTLYIDSKSSAADLCIFPIEDWENQTKGMADQLLDMGWEEERFPPWLPGAIAFGEIRESAYFFVVGTKESYAGQIFYLDHDDYVEEPLAQNLDVFLDMINADPAKFMYQRGCYTRYFDGKTDIQWIPKEYLSSSR
jgi:hypothetical protein